MGRGQLSHRETREINALKQRGKIAAETICAIVVQRMMRTAPSQVKRMAVESSPSSSSDDDKEAFKLQPKVKRMTMQSNSIDNGNEDVERQTKFRRFSEKLNADVDCDRDTPPQLDSSDLGSPTKIWSLLCRKDELYRRECKLLAKHQSLRPMMRSMLFEWLMEVCEDRRLHRETFHLTADYSDRFLQNSSNVTPNKLQLVGATALTIATKMEEIYPPQINDIAGFTAGGCTAEEILDLEPLMLQKLDWSCAPVTCVHWLALYLQLMGKPSEGLREQNVLNDISNSQGTPRTHFTNISPYSDISRATTTTDGSFLVNTSYSDGHIYVDQRCTVPKLMRDEFVRLSRILDLCLLDIDSLQFSYSELAAAVVYSIFDPKELILEITGFRRSQLVKACDFVEPFIQVCEKTEPVGCPIPQFDGIPHDDWHNIQVAYCDALKELTKVQTLRKEILARRKTSEMIIRVHRKRMLH